MVCLVSRIDTKEGLCTLPVHEDVHDALKLRTIYSRIPIGCQRSTGRIDGDELGHKIYLGLDNGRSLILVGNLLKENIHLVGWIIKWIVIGDFIDQQHLRQAQ
jgi:hypothetical protein